MKEAVEKLKEMLPDLSERLDNTLKFLELLKRDQRLATLAANAEKLAAEQSNLSQDSAAAEPGHEKDLLDRINQLSKDVASQLQHDSASGQQASRAPSSKSVDSLGRSMRSHTSRNRMPPQESMNSMSSSLMSMSQELKDMLSSAESAQMQHAKDVLLGMASEALDLSQWQQGLEDQAQESRDQAGLGPAEQALKEGIRKSANGLDSLSMLPPDMQHQIGKSYQDALKSSDNVIGMLGKADAGLAMSETHSALNGLSGALLDALSGMENGQSGEGGSGEGLMNGLKKLLGPSRCNQFRHCGTSPPTSSGAIRQLGRAIRSRV